MAWVYDRYVRETSLYTEQDAAHTAQRGLWSEKEATPPWAWRKKR
jgi:micrococcal nuclease